MAKQTYADNVDANGKVFKTVGDNIREGARAGELIDFSTITDKLETLEPDISALQADVIENEKVIKQNSDDISSLIEDIVDLNNEIAYSFLLNGGKIKEFFDVKTHGIVTDFVMKANMEYTIINASSIEFNGFIDGDSSNSKTFYKDVSEVTFTPKITGKFSVYKATATNEDYIDLIVLCGNRKEIEDLKSALKISQIAPKVLTVKKDGSGNYNTFTDMLKGIKGDRTNKIIYVYGGDYDIFEEMGGKSFASSLKSEDLWENVNNIIPPNTTIIGVGNVNLLYMPNDEDVTSNSANLISPINLRSGEVTIENINIKCKNCRYAIHDEAGDTAEQYTHKYTRVTATKNFGKYGKSQTFGGGLGYNATIVINECDFTGDKTPVVSFHNNLQDDVDSSNISILNSVISAPENIAGLALFNTYRAQEKNRKNNVTCCNSYIPYKLILGLNGNRDTPNTFKVKAICCNDFMVEQSGITVNDYDPVKINVIS